ncbi:MAG: CapA family protein [Pseudonocardia sp.]
MRGRIRDLRIAAVLGAVAALAVAAVGVSLAVVEPPPVPVVARDVAVGPDGTLTVAFVGDTMLGDEAQVQIDQRATGYDWPFDGVRESAASADFVMAVAETPISAHTVPWNPAKQYSYSSRPPVAEALARAGVDAVQLANNHAYDTGPIGLTDTIAHLDAAGIASIGAGPDLERAQQPLLLRTELGMVGIVAIGESFGHRAADDAGGTLVMSPETIERGAAAARAAGADWVVAFAHWGDNYAPVNPAQQAAAQLFAAAGYDMVVASGPHSTQPIELVGGMPVVYSLGNWVFGTPGRWATNGVQGLGLVAELRLGRDRPAELAVRCLVTDNDVVDFQPRFCDPAQAQAFLPTLSPLLRMDGDTGVLACTDCFVRTRESSAEELP